MYIFRKSTLIAALILAGAVGAQERPNQHGERREATSEDIAVLTLQEAKYISNSIPFLEAIYGDQIEELHIDIIDNAFHVTPIIEGKITDRNYVVDLETGVEGIFGVR